MEEELRDFNPFNGRLPLLEVYHTYSRSHWDWELVEEYEPGEVLWVFYMDNIYINRKGCVWYNGSVKGFDRERPDLEGRFTYIPEISTMKIVIPRPPRTARRAGYMECGRVRTDISGLPTRRRYGKVHRLKCARAECAVRSRKEVPAQAGTANITRGGKYRLVRTAWEG